MKTLKVLFGTLFIILCWGVFIPLMISSDSYIGLIAGVLSIITFIYWLVLAIEPKVIKIINKLKNKN